MASGLHWAPSDRASWVTRHRWARATSLCWGSMPCSYRKCLLGLRVAWDGGFAHRTHSISNVRFEERSKGQITCWGASITSLDVLKHKHTLDTHGQRHTLCTFIPGLLQITSFSASALALFHMSSACQSLLRFYLIQPSVVLTWKSLTRWVRFSNWNQASLRLLTGGCKGVCVWKWRHAD